MQPSFNDPLQKLCSFEHYALPCIKLTWNYQFNIIHSFYALNTWGSTSWQISAMNDILVSYMNDILVSYMTDMRSLFTISLEKRNKKWWSLLLLLFLFLWCLWYLHKDAPWMIKRRWVTHRKVLFIQIRNNTKTRLAFRKCLTVIFVRVNSQGTCMQTWWYLSLFFSFLYFIKESVIFQSLSYVWNDIYYVTNHASTI